MAGQHTAVNTFPGLVHTARHTMRVGWITSFLRRKKRVLYSKEFLFIFILYNIEINNKNCLLFNVLYLNKVHIIKYGAVAQLARAPALQAGGQEFDSP